MQVELLNKTTCPVTHGPLPPTGTPEYESHIHNHFDETGRSVADLFQMERYYNANYVHGYTFGSSATGNPHDYIAAEGPTPATTKNFVQLIFEQRAACVIMVTRLMEGTRKKCNRYWPESPGQTLPFGMFQVKNVGEEKHSAYLVTTLEITDGKRTHRTCHYWFTQWPDHGVYVTSTQARFTFLSVYMCFCFSFFVFFVFYFVCVCVCVSLVISSEPRVNIVVARPPLFLSPCQGGRAGVGEHCHLEVAHCCSFYADNCAVAFLP